MKNYQNLKFEAMEPKFDIEKCKGEGGVQITQESLFNTLVIAHSKGDFINKVTYGWTNETSQLPDETVRHLELFWEQV
jgi:hypothetical protein